MGKNVRGNMHDQLKSLLPNVRTTKSGRQNNRNPMISPEMLGNDGDDHINIWDEGKTDLGKVLAHSTSIAFSHSIFGRFNSMEAFWHYIRSEERDDRIRVINSKALKKFVSKLTNVRVPNFRAIIMDSNWQKVNQYPAIVNAIKESTLPFDCYYVYQRTGGVRIRPVWAHWVIPGFEEIRRALKEDREPNFDNLKDTKNIGIYDAVLPKRDVVAQEETSESEELCSLLQQAVAEPAQGSSIAEEVVAAATALEVEEVQAPTVPLAPIQEVSAPSMPMGDASGTVPQ
jgi:hypothetical protein